MHGCAILKDRKNSPAPSVGWVCDIQGWDSANQELPKANAVLLGCLPLPIPPIKIFEHILRKEINAPSFLRAFYPPKRWSSRNLEEQPARPSTPPCRAPRVGPNALHLHLPQVVSIACSPDVWKPRLVTPDWLRRETWAGRKQFE